MDLLNGLAFPGLDDHRSFLPEAGTGDLATSVRFRNTFFSLSIQRPPLENYDFPFLTDCDDESHAQASRNIYQVWIEC